MSVHFILAYTCSNIGFNDSVLTSSWHIRGSGPALLFELHLPCFIKNAGLFFSPVSANLVHFVKILVMVDDKESRK